MYSAALRSEGSSVSPTRQTLPNEPDIPTPAVRAELEKILAARAFANSGRQSRFLRFVVEQALEGRGPQLKEYLIGVEVYDRGDGYDPRVDTIVRVEASRLRSRLAEYYKNEGRADPLRIDLPRGTYIPSFEQIAAPPPPSADRRNLLAGAAAALLVVGIAIAWAMHNRPTPAVSPAPSVAVLPFTDISPEKDQEYFCDGMTEELISALSRVDGLRVAARTSSFQFKGQAQDVRAVGARLNVGHVLEGSVRKAGDRLRISAQLIKTADGYHVWSETFDRDLKDVFAVQEQIAAAIVDNLKLKLAVQPRGLPRTGNLESYNLYLQGRFFQSKFTPEGEHRAIELFEQSIQRDPSFASAYAGLADTYQILGFWGMLRPLDAGPKALVAANKALELDATLCDPHVSLGAFQALYRWNFAESEREFRRAIELNPGKPYAHTYYGLLCLTPLGRLDEALQEARRARELDPLSRETSSTVGLIHYYRREYDQAIAALRQTLELDPSFGEAYPELASAYLAKGRFPEALAAIQKLQALGEVGRSKCLMAYMDALAGKSGEARRLLAEIDSPPSQLAVAAIHLALGDREPAFRALGKAIQEHDNHLIWLNVTPQLDSLRGDPRFAAILRQVNLPVTTR
jgi:TolB-like protein/Tfp pilus assembly protein PilF